MFLFRNARRARWYEPAGALSGVQVFRQWSPSICIYSHKSRRTGDMADTERPYRARPFQLREI